MAHKSKVTSVICIFLVTLTIRLILILRAQDRSRLHQIEQNRALLRDECDDADVDDDDSNIDKTAKLSTLSHLPLPATAVSALQSVPVPSKSSVPFSLYAPLDISPNNC